MLIALILWMLFVVIVPNSAIFLSQNSYPIENADTIQEKINSARDVIESNAPEGRWFSVSNQPFHPLHEVRANHQMNLMNSEMRIRNEYYRDIFSQLERARVITFISPVSLFEYLCEAVVGGGYLRFQQVWDRLKAFQIQFLGFFKEKDAADQDSPHWYNPNEDVSTSRKPVNFGEVPVFEEEAISFEARFSHASTYLLVMILYTAVIFFLTFVLFVRYDVR